VPKEHSRQPARSIHYDISRPSIASTARQGGIPLNRNALGNIGKNFVIQPVSLFCGAGQLIQLSPIYPHSSGTGTQLTLKRVG
jgi:hypothetical protein